MGNNYKETLKKQLKNPEFKAEWDALEAQYSIINEIINTRSKLKLTQKQLSDITGISQADISEIENGNRNPTIKTLQRIADGLGKELHIEFR